MTVTPRQMEVLDVLAGADRPLMAWQVRDRIYPPDSPMRARRTRGRNNVSGVLGGLGNLAAGRILANLDSKGLVRRDPSTFAYSISEAGRRAQTSR